MEESQNVLSYVHDCVCVCVCTGLVCQENVSFVFIPPAFLNSMVPWMPLSSLLCSFIYLSCSFTTSQFTSRQCFTQADAECYILILATFVIFINLIAL